MREPCKRGILIFVILIALFGQLMAQDSVVVYQKHSQLFTNKYVFYPNQNFRHYFITDDGQIWYGTGTYIDKDNRRTLYFGDPDTAFKTLGLIHYESNFVRTLRIKGQMYVSKDFYGTSGEKKVVFIKK